MRKEVRIALLFAMLALVAPEVAVSQSNAGDTFVKGTTDFLLDRANDNLIYVFQRKLESNPLMQKYLPATLRVVKAGDLRSLITHKDLWKVALTEDFKNGRLLVAASKNIDTVVTGLCEAAKSIGDPLPPKLANLCAKAKANPASSDVKNLAQPPAERTVTELGLFESDNEKFTRIFNALSELLRSVNQIDKTKCEELDSGKKYTACVIEVLDILKATAHADYTHSCFLYGNWCWNRGRALAPSNREEDDSFSDFRRYALFFAQLADAADTNDRNQVNALLKSATIPPVSFGIKRESHATRVLITSYVGGAWAEQITTNQQTYVVAAPVGIEISQARDSGNSLSFMLSPLDFGYPLSLKLNGADTKIKASDVVVPSAYVFYGLKNYPLAIGTGYARVRNIDNPDKREGRFLVLIAFDMPLFKLH